MNGASVPVGDSVVVCRPGQLREAAIVASYAPAGTVYPVVTLEPQPSSRAEYLALYRRFREGDLANLSRLGTSLGQQEALEATDDPQRAAADILAHQADRLALSPYRSMLKYKVHLNALVPALGITRAIFLFAPTEDDLNTEDPGYESARRGDTATPLFAQLTTIALGTGGEVGLADLQARVDDALTDDRTPSGRPVRIAPDAPSAAFVEGLFAALGRGVRLRVADVDDGDVSTEAGSLNTASDEAVLVEDTASAGSLLGAIYARYRGARLVITPRPDLSTIQRAVRVRQEQIDGRRTRGVDDSVPVEEFVRDDASMFSGLVHAVSASVPDHVVRSVGDRRLTAFTTGVPYPFTRKCGVDWSSKPIGHVVADPELVLLREFLTDRSQPDPASSFSMILDPGYFEDSETEDVLESLSDGTSSWPLLLSGADASLGPLLALTHALPVDVLFFNTHGYDDGIVLEGNQELPSALVASWLTLTNGSVVVNNSCQSWTGVGTEFVRAGARGYVGSLWSIPNNLAADFARVVALRLVREAATVTSAIVDTGLPGLIERSYIVAGTANTRLTSARTGDTGPPDPEAQVLRAWTSLTLVNSQAQGVSRFLQRTMHDMRERLTGTGSGRTAEFLTLALEELRLFKDHRPPERGDLAEARALIDTIEARIEHLADPEKRRDLASSLAFVAGDLYGRFGEHRLADSSYAPLYDSTRSPSERAHVLSRQANEKMHRGDIEGALLAAREAHALYREAGNDGGVMVATGVLGQIHKRLGQHDEALRCAEEGYRRAVELEDLHEQQAFKTDESSLLQRLNRFDEATDAAEAAIRLARLAHDEMGELISVGRLAGCLIATDRLDEATTRVLWGVRQAQNLSHRKEEAGFRFNMAEIAEKRGWNDDAVNSLLDATGIYVEVGAYLLAATILHRACRVIRESADRRRSTHRAVQLGLEICRVMGESYPLDLLDVLVDRLKDAAVGPAAGPTLNRWLDTIDGIRESRSGYPVNVLLPVVSALYCGLSTRTASIAVALAGEVDQQLDDRFALAAFVRSLGG